MFSCVITGLFKAVIHPKTAFESTRNKNEYLE